MAQHVYHWKHGWIPLTHTAALSKAKGNHERADALLRDAHSPEAGMHSRQHVAKALVDLPKIETPTARADAMRQVKAAAVAHNAGDLLPGRKEPAFLQGVARFEGEHATAYRYANVDYDPSKIETTINCVKVAQAYELRRRGYAVSAQHGPAQVLNETLADMWRNTETGKRIQIHTAHSRAELESVMAGDPPGARYHVSTVWKGRPPGMSGSHMFNAEKQADGTVTYFDAQVRLADASSHLDAADFDTFGVDVYRVDNATPADNPAWDRIINK